RYSRPAGCSARSCSSACVSSIISTIGLLRSSRSVPASVRLTERVERISSRALKRDSSSATYLLTLALEMPRRLAAAEKPPCAATSWKVLIRSRLSMAPVLFREREHGGSLQTMDSLGIQFKLQGMGQRQGHSR